MKCVRERPRRKNVHVNSNEEREDTENIPQIPDTEHEGSRRYGRSSQDGEQTAADHSVENSLNNDNDQINKTLSESDKDTLRNLNISLCEQKEVFKTEEEYVEANKQTAKERINSMFSNLRELLARKENELLDKVELEYTTAERFLADFVSSIEDEKRKVSTVLDSDSLLDETGVDVDIGQIKEDIDASVNMRSDILNQFRTPYFVLNDQCLERVNSLNFGGFQEFSTSDDEQTEDESEVYDNRETEIGETTLVAEDGTIANSIRNRLNLSSGDENSEENIGECAEGSEPVGDREQRLEKEIEGEGATGVYTESCQPSAPPMLLEESPPPYWQAMGLQGPEVGTQPRSEIPGYFDLHHSRSHRLPENKLELWHSFPIRRQYDRRGPMPVALAWNHGKICIADRTNMRVKFFFPNGQLITEMYFSGIEIHDLTFLEEALGESRYVLTSPKSKTLMIIGIDSQNIPKVIRKLVFPKQYSSVCRGPRVQTLIGAEITSQTGGSVVDMFNFTGQILLSINHTPTFVFLQYVRRVEAFGNHIIVLDWKINSLSVYQDDGTAVCEYRGTSNSPLINPLDMTLDNQGNIMILNGEFSNIHVVDLHCNLIEIMKLPRSPSSASNAKLIAFDLKTRRLAVARSNGDIAVFTFQNGYDCLSQRNLPPNLAQDTSSSRRAPEVLPLIEGMLPSTIEDIITRQPVRNRSRPFHL